MHITLQTSSLLPPESEEDQNQGPDPLHLEHGWRSVASGLTSVLIGHIVWLLAVIVAIILFVVAFFQFLDWDPEEKTGFTPGMTVFFGMMLLGLFSLLSFIMILCGKWLCAVNASERGGAKWLIFGCMLLILLGPAISLITTFSSPGASHEITLDKDGVLHVELTTVGAIMKMIGGVIGFAGTLLFVLFLRAVAVNFGNGILKSMTETYLICSGIFVVLTFQVGLSVEEASITSLFVMIVSIIVFLILIWYLFMIFAARSTILNGFANLRNPLDVIEEREAMIAPEEEAIKTEAPVFPGEEPSEGITTIEP